MENTPLTKDIAEGQQAKELLEHPLLVAAFETIEKDIFDAWRESKTNETSEREQAWLNYRGLVLFKQKLHALYTNGEIAKSKNKESAT